MPTPHAAANDDGTPRWDLATLALIYAALVARRTPGHLLRELPNRVKTTLWERCRDQGYEHEAAHEYEDAATVYQLMTHLDPTDALGWYLLTGAHLGNDQPQQALDTLHHARDAISIQSPLDLLDLELIAHWHLGHTDTIGPLLDQIATHAPHLAHMIVHDLDLHEIMHERNPDWWENAPRKRPPDGHP